ncbi:hypothetical protein SEA_LUMOS_117 [Mycobacterium phage Lumos]|uniref:Uncharacterized protein n=1 Tax=Mycobacterium phage Lumos TaxID=1701852 RepID=A0A0K2CMM5_9CAUD|nr:hypothetical protein AVU96_gp073 [Mycobacterium phage Snenia]YP_010012565.1 hypothetical protein J4T93_gp071 [Mycobacterium phage Lumos]ASM62844.1 hypothetical protein SEA_CLAUTASTROPHE_116 [Mycobacterium phage Clautastrophe]QDF16691.1 hypothetical protein PBI_MSGREEN_118 [Mycobacterium phage MsGreen]QPL14991.1 hypothetical protein SEA_JUBIE_117 [Mycobacterium phage Jubie]ALA06623.1 hypothetical protein SEA_LUMOS_117 [Mycobacterium phage Lumos]ALF01562.1 hypothetical protein SNENIA_116 [My
MKARVRFGINGQKDDKDDLSGERVMDHVPRLGDTCYKNGVALEVAHVVWTFDPDSLCDVIVLFETDDLDAARKFFKGDDHYV